MTAIIVHRVRIRCCCSADAARLLRRNGVDDDDRHDGGWGYDDEEGFYVQIFCTEIIHILVIVMAKKRKSSFTFSNIRPLVVFSTLLTFMNTNRFHFIWKFLIWRPVFWLSIRNKVNVIRTQGTQRMLSSTAQWIILYFFPSRLSFWTTQVLSWKKSQLKWKNAKKMYE